MSLLKKIFTAVRGGAREMGESIVDANSIRILDQEIKDAEKHMGKAKQDLTSVMAKEMQAGREIDRLKKDIAQHEGYTMQALDKGDESLAADIAAKIAAMESELADQQGTKESFSSHSSRLKELVKKTERQLGEYKRQLVMVRTTDSVQKATAAITNNFASGKSKLLSATESLARIKKKQQEFDDRLKASEQLEGETADKSLEEKMRSAGIGAQSSSGNSVLDRIKAKRV